MNEEHQPDPEFISHLEWQVRTSLTRGNRFSLPAPRNGKGRARMILLVVLSGFLGAGAVMAKGEVQESRAQGVLLIRVQGQQRIAALQLEVALAILNDIREQYGEGLISRGQLIGAELPVREAEAHLMRLRLDEEEIRKSGKPPQNDISAPRVGGRDYVTERLVVQMATAQERLSSVEERLAWMEEEVESGVVGPEFAEQFRTPIAEMEAEIAGMQERVALRQRYVAGDLTAGEAETALEITDAESQLQRHRLAHERLSRELRSVEEAVEAGLVPESQLERFLLQLTQVELEMEMLQRTLVLLRGG